MKAQREITELTVEPLCGCGHRKAEHNAIDGCARPGCPCLLSYASASKTGDPLLQIEVYLMAAKEHLLQAQEHTDAAALLVAKLRTG